MPSDLTSMTLEELWELFPIELVPHNPEWKSWAAEEISLLSRILLPYGASLSHIGSTAIEGIMAKPIIDILVEVDTTVDCDEVRKLLTAHGYICMAASGPRMSFNKGYTPQGYAERVFHIHIRPSGDNAEIRFRDYLNSHPSAAREYEELKMSLLPHFRNDRDGYTHAKTPFVERINRLTTSQEND